MNFPERLFLCDVVSRLPERLHGQSQRTKVRLGREQVKRMLSELH